MNEKSSHLNIQTPVIILAFLLFAGCVVSVILSGAGVYKRLVAADGSAYSVRTAQQYIKTKVRTAVSPENISVAEIGGDTALCFSESIDGREYRTYIYSCDGGMRELFTSVDAGLPTEGDLAFGEFLMDMESLNFSLDSGLLTVNLSLSDSGGSRFFLNLGVTP